MIHLVEGAERQKTPNEIALTILLSALTIIFLVVVITLKFFGSIRVFLSPSPSWWRFWYASSPPRSGACSPPSGSPGSTGSFRRTSSR